MKTISELTPILPYLLADSVTDNEQSNKTLCERAERHFKNSQQFRKKVLSKGNNGRDYLLMFMRHWHKGMKLK